MGGKHSEGHVGYPKHLENVTSLAYSNMSRGSVRTFLVSAKKHLQQIIRNKGAASFVIGNESADLDSITCAILYGYVKSSTLHAWRTKEFVIPVTNIPAADLPLRPELTALLKHAGVKPTDLITLDDLKEAPSSLQSTKWTLVDHNVFQGSLGEQLSQDVAGVIDHHVDEKKVPDDARPRMIETAGSCSSLVVNYCREDWDSISSAAAGVGAANGQEHGVIDDVAYTSTWDAQLAQLALGSILIDTVNMTDDSKVTDHDRKAVRYLEAKINASPKIGKDFHRETFYNELNDAKSNLDDLTLDDILRKDYKQWTERGIALGISTVVKPLQYLEGKSNDPMSGLQSFGEQRNLDLFAIMTAFVDGEGVFRRQLLLMALRRGIGFSAATGFTKSQEAELQLQSLNWTLSNTGTHQEIPWTRLWNQHNVAASRKQVAPLLREALMNADSMTTA